MRKSKTHTRAQVLALAGKSYCDVRTVLRWIDGVQPVRPTVRERLEQAARELGIPLPGAA